MTENEAAAQGTTDPADLVAQAERHAPDRNLALELVRVTEAGAMAAARWVGRGDKNGADGAAGAGLRPLHKTGSMDGVGVVGQGGEEPAPQLFHRAGGGDRHRPGLDISRG